MHRFPGPAGGLPLFLKFGICALVIAAPIAAAASFPRLYRQFWWSRDLGAIPLRAETRVIGRVGDLRVVSRPGYPPRHVGSEAFVSEVLPAWIPLPEGFMPICPGRPITALLSYTAARDSDLELLERAPGLCVVELDGTFITDDGIRRLRKLKTLHRLELAYTDISDAGLETLADVASLKILNLSGTKITNRGLKFLSRLPNLETLDLSETLVTGQGLVELRTLARLETLKLDHLAIDESDLEFLCELSTLQTLSLAGTQVTDAGLMKLASLPALRTVSLARSCVSEAGNLRFETARREPGTLPTARPYRNSPEFRRSPTAP